MPGSSFERDGFALLDDEVPTAVLDQLVEELTTKSGSPNRRSLLRDSTFVAAFVMAPPLKQIADWALEANAFAVRALLFDKVADANWGVPWHQDLAIPVAQKVAADGFHGWSVKDGVPHVLAPAEVLAGMVTLRLHLDECGSENGPLRVLPGSHRAGILDDGAMTCCRERTSEFTCVARRGTILAIRPLLLHASSAARRPGHRRVLHVEYAGSPLPGRLRWFDTSAAARFPARHPINSPDS